MKVAVIGAGISGLATAYYLKKSNPEIEIQIFEASNRAGGILETIHQSGALMECGPDAFISEKPWALELCRELGLEDQIISTRSEFRRSFILNQGELKPLPEGFYLIAPKTFKAWWNLPGMSLIGKLRMLGDLFLPAKKDDADESVADFVCRRFGNETLTKLAQPMIGGIYGSRPETLSLKATFPKFAEMEKQFGSVMRGLTSTEKVPSTTGTGNMLPVPVVDGTAGPRYSLFLSLRNGMETLTQKLASILKDQIHFSAAVKTIEPRQSDGWGIQTGWGSYEVDAVCLAVPADKAAEMLQSATPDLAAKLSQIRFESMATINFLFNRSAIKASLEGFGFVVPATEKSSLVGCSFSHRKFEGRVLNDDQVLLRVFAGGAYGAETFSKTDQSMVNLILDDLSRILSISESPMQVSVRRYPNGMPQYEVNHLNRIQEIFEMTQKQSGLFLTGNSYYGIGIPDCVRRAQQTASKIALFVLKAPTEKRGKF